MISRAKIPWTEEETNEFKKFVSENLTLTDEKIAEVFGRSLRSIFLTKFRTCQKN
jgi:hypothetical protein